MLQNSEEVFCNSYGAFYLFLTVRIGELINAVPKGSGGDRRSENFKFDSGVDFEKTDIKKKADEIVAAGC